MAFGSVFQHDEARRTGRALAHGQQAVHAGFSQVLLVQHGAFETGIGGQLLRFFGQQGGGEQIGRRVVQTAGQAHGLGRAFATAGGLLAAVGHEIALKGHGQPLGSRGGVLGGLFEIIFVQGQAGGVDAFFHQALTAAGQGGQLGFQQQDGFQAQFVGTLHTGGHGRADVVRGQVFTGAQADGQHARHAQFGMAVQQGLLALLALEVAHGGRDGQPGSQIVQRGAGFQHVLALADGHYENLGLPLVGAEALKTDVHRFLRSIEMNGRPALRDGDGGDCHREEQNIRCAVVFAKPRGALPPRGLRPLRPEPSSVRIRVPFRHARLHPRPVLPLPLPLLRVPFPTAGPRLARRFAPGGGLP